MGLLSLKDMLIDTQNYNRHQLDYVMNRVFFFAPRHIISFPKTIGFKFPKEENQEPIKCLDPYDYDYKDNSYHTSFNSNSRLILKYDGNLNDIVLEPPYRKLNKLKETFKRNSISGFDNFHLWRRYYTYIGEISECEDNEVLIWEGEKFQFYFNKNFIPPNEIILGEAHD